MDKTILPFLFILLWIPAFLNLYGRIFLLQTPFPLQPFFGNELLQDILAQSVFLKIVLQTELLQDKGTPKPPQSRTFEGHIAPKSFPMRGFYKIPALKTIRTNPAFPPLKFTTAPQNIDRERVLIYV
jgi:hypothetical protein